MSPLNSLDPATVFTTRLHNEATATSSVEAHIKPTAELSDAGNALVTGNLSTRLASGQTTFTTSIVFGEPLVDNTTYFSAQSRKLSWVEMRFQIAETMRQVETYQRVLREIEAARNATRERGT